MHERHALCASNRSQAEEGTLLPTHKSDERRVTLLSPLLASRGLNCSVRRIHAHPSTFHSLTRNSEPCVAGSPSRS
jgi:hypothetical protein